MRAEAKDYRDIAAILADGRVSLSQALGGAARLYGAPFAPLAALKALSYFADGDVPSLPAGMRAALIDAVRAVDPTAADAGAGRAWVRPPNLHNVSDRTAAMSNTTLYDTDFHGWA